MGFQILDLRFEIWDLGLGIEINLQSAILINLQSAISNLQSSNCRSVGRF